MRNNMWVLLARLSYARGAFDLVYLLKKNSTK